ncbi:MAG TPA: hypothetical protein VG603_15340 [Chitinophagales bacterium]|nr:hypothetical protein [Chitinophagales bacterium]
MYYRIFLVVAIAAFFTACNQQPSERRHFSKEEMAARIDSLKGVLLKTDLEFSKMSESNGRNAAFLAYADSDVTLLRPYSMPVSGKNTLEKLLAEHPDSAFTLSWIPIKADISRAGDLGYTFGTYQLKDKKGKKGEGTYCTVWRRSRNGDWKFVMDTGNEGLKPEDQEK